jgi:UDP-glucose 4-epimerase
VTGATGFVGKAVHKSLDRHIVRLTSRNSPVVNSAEFFGKTISSTTDFSDCLANIDVVIHTAAIVHQLNDKSVFEYVRRCVQKGLR